MDLAATIGGSTGDGADDEVIVRGTNGEDAIAADANGSAAEVSGLAAFVRITHADPGGDTLILDTLDGDDDVTVDPALAALIQISVK